jgi:hypothetical protein
VLTNVVFVLHDRGLLANTGRSHNVIDQQLRAVHGTRVTLREVGLREGLQSHESVLTTEQKVDLFRGLKEAAPLGGGVEPLWRRDGAELFFRNPRGDMYVVTVGPGRQFEHGAPRLLFSRPGMALQEFYRSYDVHPDGKRFLMLKSGVAEARDLNVIFNWRPELQSYRGATR